MLIDRNHIIDGGGVRVVRSHPVVDRNGGYAGAKYQSNRLGGPGHTATKDVGTTMHMDKKVILMRFVNRVGHHVERVYTRNRIRLD
jgi:hypothetical protein